MSDSFVLTFAEIEFLLQSREPAIPTLRESFELPAVDPSTAAAGLASLLARGLCTVENGAVAPGEEVVASIAGLATADRVVKALGWVDERMVLVHILSGPSAVVALFPGQFGLYTLTALDHDVAVADQVARFLDSCLTGLVKSSVLVQSTTAGSKVSVAVAVDENGEWFLSDSVALPDGSAPSSRDAAVARIAELLAEQGAGAL